MQAARWKANQILFPPVDTDGYFCTHKKCGSCTLCECSLERAHYGFVYNKNKSENLPVFEITCKGPPGSIGWCSDEIGPYKKASKRLEELNMMDLENIRNILKERKVSWRRDESKESLVCKVIVMDKKKGDVTCNIVTHTDASGNETHARVKSREAPGAILRDRRCSHGAQWNVDDSPAQRRKRSAFGHLIPTMMQTNNFDLHRNAIVDFLVDRQDELRDDIQERFIPGLMWASAVEAVIKEEGSFGYSSMHIFAYLIIDKVIDRIASISPTENLTKRDIVGVVNHPDIRNTLGKIMESEDTLYLFMHRFENRYCDCMKFVAAAIESGSLRHEKEMEIKVDVEHCALCNAALARPQVCSACKEVAYCGAHHQREHWKVHKRECKGRKKKKIQR